MEEVIEAFQKYIGASVKVLAARHIITMKKSVNS